MKRSLSLLTAVCMLILMVACSPRNTPTSLAKQYFKVLKSEKYENASKLFYVDNSDEAAAERQLSQLKSFINTKIVPRVTMKGGVESFKISNEVINDEGSRATVEVVIKYGNGSTVNQKIGLICIDGTWYVDSGR